MDAMGRVKRVDIIAKVTRADGRIENLGMISSTNRFWKIVIGFKNLWRKIKTWLQF